MIRRWFGRINAERATAARIRECERMIEQHTVCAIQSEAIAQDQALAATQHFEAA